MLNEAEAKKDKADRQAIIGDLQALGQPWHDIDEPSPRDNEL